MKKLITLLLALALSLTAVFAVGCGYTSEKPEKDSIVIAMPDGAPVLSVYQLMKDVKVLDGHAVEYKIMSGAPEIATGIAKGEVDVAVMPVNVAAKFYNKGTDIKLLSVNVFGCLYMVGKNPLENGLETLKGKVLVNIGQGASPDITMKLILDRNGIPYEESAEPVEGKVALRYVSAAPEAIALLKAGKADYGVLGEPAASNAAQKLGASIVLDLQSVWNDLLGKDSFTQAGVVLANSTYSDNGLIEALLVKLRTNNAYVLTDIDNVQETLTALGSTLSGNFNENLIKRCNLKCEKASDIKVQLESYFNAVYQYDPNFIGGKLPDDGFYYGL